MKRRCLSAMRTTGLFGSAFVCLLLCVQNATADDVPWSGEEQANNNWSDPDNWDFPDPPSSSDNARFNIPTVNAGSSTADGLFGGQINALLVSQPGYLTMPEGMFIETRVEASQVNDYIIDVATNKSVQVFSSGSSVKNVAWVLLPGTTNVHVNGTIGPGRWQFETGTMLN